jgi:hypothetical protein
LTAWARRRENGENLRPIGLLTITKLVGGDFCDGGGCTISPLNKKVKCVIKPEDGKDQGAVTLLPQ